MFGQILVDLFKVIGDVLMNFYMSMEFRWFVYILVFFLNFVAYRQNPLLYTDNNKCYGMKCRWVSFITGLGACTLYLFGLISLWYVLPFSDILPDYWYLPVIALSYAIIIQLTISVQPVQDNGEFNPPPQHLWSKNKRIWLFIVILILDLIYFHQMYIDGGVSLVPNSRLIDSLILGRFGGINKDKLSFFIGWFGIIGLLFDVLALRLTSSFDACTYGLPKSWNF